MKKKVIAILFGGVSTEHSVSLLSSINIISAIDLKKYDLILIGIDQFGRWALCDKKNYLINAHDPKNIKLALDNRYLAIVPGKNRVKLIETISGNELPDIAVVLSVLHGANGENGSIQGLLETINIPYVSTKVLSSAICMDKDITKKILKSAGIPVTDSITLRSSDNLSFAKINTIIDMLGLPLFVKPSNQGSSLGISKVIERLNFKKALSLAFSYSDKILIEKGINCREIEIAVLGNINPEISVCGEVIINDSFYTYDAKYINSYSDLIIPAKIPTVISDKIRYFARKAYSALECSIMARIDFFLTKEGLIFLNEVNTLPGFTSTSMYPKLWEFSGLNYSLLIDRLISLALDRYNNVKC